MMDKQVNKNVELHKRRERAVPRAPYNISQVYVDKARGAKVQDVEGKEYIDFAGGIGIQNIGHNHPKVVAAIKEQVDQFIHPCFHVAPYESYITLAERLNALTPGDFAKKTILLNSGAEAVENAIKIARKFTGKSGVISFDRAYHGRTLLTMSLTSKVKPYKHGFGPFANNTYKLPYPYYYRKDSFLSNEEYDDRLVEQFNHFLMLEASPDEIGAIIMEPVQGEGGFIVPSKRFVQGIKRVCEENNILFIADEIQTGFCRTGKLFAMENFDIAPDLTTLSKSIAGGMPLSAVTGRADVMDAAEIGQLGGTFGGSPVACAAGNAVLDVIKEEHLVDKSRVLGEKMMKLLQEMKERHDVIGDVRGLGSMCAIEIIEAEDFKQPNPGLTTTILQACWDKGLMTLKAGTYGNVLRFLPPVVIADEDLERGLAIVDEAITENK
ncbi:4-aminobutyrate aminotransferase [Pontibacillus litoralis JSM 072002]|uniref:(S)-3-amino-2-methylpropionate transaminase n=2 Tax=Pontibacillus TaxID=289201 RepID=A0A0A5GAG9_9BACI|nr:4-aminobutyrate aminotransferase [Pontibacillus litoralis JSM 072002]